MLKKNDMSVTFLQHFHNNLKWQVVNGWYKWEENNLSCKFKLWPITTYHLWFVVKILWT